jgi:hypothetical protein
MNDLYSKAVMTIIAVALTVIAGNSLFGSAQAQMGNCGDKKSDPCHVTVVNTAAVRGAMDAIRQECGDYLNESYGVSKWSFEQFEECVYDNTAAVRVRPEGL